MLLKCLWTFQAITAAQKFTSLSYVNNLHRSSKTGANLRNQQRHQSHQNANGTICANAYPGDHRKRETHYDHPEDHVHCVQDCIGLETAESLEPIDFLSEVLVGKEDVGLYALETSQ